MTERIVLSLTRCEIQKVIEMDKFEVGNGNTTFESADPAFKPSGLSEATFGMDVPRSSFGAEVVTMTHNYACLDVAKHLSHVFGLSAISATACATSAVKLVPGDGGYGVFLDQSSVVRFLDQWNRGQGFNAVNRVLNAIERLGLRGHMNDGTSPIPIGDFIRLLQNDSPLGLS